MLLKLVYFGLLTPFGAFSRLLGYDVLHRRFDSESNSYWVHRRTEAGKPINMKSKF